jgi:tRNA modification GTPase
MRTDTIMAQATARGKSALAILRLSGPEAISILESLFRPRRRFKDMPSHSCRVGLLSDGESTVDQVVATLYRAPNSYTGEDLVEISCHGGPLIVSQILTLLEQAGARPAIEGEFTNRAFLNGKIDLAQAEAICALIEARSSAGARAALRILAGDLGKTLSQSLATLTSLQARLEVTLDVLEEGAPDVLGDGAEKSPESIIAAEIERLDKLLAGGRTGRLLEDGIHIALAGRPNAGKSSIFNAFLSRDRAIVSPEPGTTRDSLEGWVEWDGLPLVLLDTAGLREPESAAEAEGIIRTRTALKSASIVVFVVDVTSEPLDQIDAAVLELDHPAESIVVALHKWDQLTSERRSEIDSWRARAGESVGVAALVPSSVVGDPGEEQLQTTILQCLSQGIGDPEATLLVGDRQRLLIGEAGFALTRALGLAREQAGEELIAFELRSALEHLGQLLGKSIGPMILDEIFAKFCIGK